MSNTSSSTLSSYSNKSTLGIVRFRTNKFLELRKKTTEENSFSKYDSGSSLNDNGKTSLLGKKSDKSSKVTELSNIKTQNHRYVDIFNATNLLYEELRQNYVILQGEQQRRIIPKFDDDENKRIDRKIKELVIDMTRKVKQAEENINQLGKLSHESSSEEEVIQNMRLNLITKIKDFSRDFQLNEEKYMRKYQELVGDKTNYLEDLDNSSGQTANINSDFLQTTDKESRFLRQRDEEISTLLTSISELSGVFKDLQTLVSHQGTILDRIDYNIDTAGDNIKQAHKSLVDTEKMMKSNCYRNSMLFIIISIFIMCILLLLKYTK